MNIGKERQPFPPGRNPSLSLFFELQDMRSDISKRTDIFNPDRIKSGVAELNDYGRRRVKTLTDPEKMARDLRMMRLALATRAQGGVSACVLTAAFIEGNLHLPTLRYAAMQKSNRDLLVFAMYIDFDSGLFNTAQSVCIAEGELKGQSEENYDEIQKAEYEHYKVGATLSEDADMYVRMKALTKSYTDKLIEDKSGFALIDESVRVHEARHPLVVMSYNIPEFVMIGSRTAQTLYKTVYPRAEQILRTG